MKSIIGTVLIALVLSGCGGSSSDPATTAAGGLSGQSTCTDWNAAPAKDKTAYLAGKDIDTGSGSPGEAISAWMDYLCGKTNPSTSYSSLTAIDDVLPAAQEQFTSGSTFPPVTAKKTKTAF